MLHASSGGHGPAQHHHGSDEGKRVDDPKRNGMPQVYQDLLDLLPDRRKHNYIDKELRLELLKYGELTQLTYDGFESRPNDKSFGEAFWKPGQFFEELGPTMSERAQRYSFMNMEGSAEGYENYLYANASVYDFRNGTEWPIWPADWKEPGEYDQDKLIELNAGWPVRNRTTSAPVWMGYIAVGPEDPEDGKHDVVVVFRGTILPGEWSANIFGNFLADFNRDKSKLCDVSAQATEEDRARVQMMKDEVGDIGIHDGFRELFATPVDLTQKRHLIVNGDDSMSPRKIMSRRLESLVTKELPGKIKTITFTGHSLGGALATVAAGHVALLQRFYVNKWEDERTAGLWRDIRLRAYTFSAPRVGGYRFRGKLVDLGVSVLNVVNARDIVPVVPGVVNTGLDWIRHPWGQGPVVAGDHLPEWNNWLKQVWAVGGWIREYLSKWNYVNSGVQFLLDSRKTEEFRNFSSGWIPTNVADVGARHNLEGLLYMLATQFSDAAHSPKVFRDVALMNKSDRLLRPEISRDLNIPPLWWSPESHKGLVAHRVISKKPATFIVRNVDGHVEPHGVPHCKDDDNAAPVPRPARVTPSTAGSRT